MVATLQTVGLGHINGNYDKATLHFLNPAAGVTSVSSPAPPSPYANWLQFDTAQAHNVTLRTNGSLAGTGSFGRFGYTEQWQIRRDGGTISQACYLVRASVVNDGFSLKWNTSGNLDVYFGGGIVTTVSVSTSTTFHLQIFTYHKTGLAYQVGLTVQIVIYKDGSLVYNGNALMNIDGTLSNGIIKNYGEDAAAGSNTVKWYVLPLIAAVTDLDNPLPKITVKEWTLTLAGTPIWNEGAKSTGTDAAALIDERPPNGSGTTDSDYVDIAGLQMQSVPMLNSLLGGGDTLYAVVHGIWDRKPDSTGKNYTCGPMRLANDATALLNGAILAGATNLSYDTATGRRNTSYSVQRLRIDNEVFTISSDSGAPSSASGNITMVGAQEGTTAANHADNAPMYWFAYDSLSTLSNASTYADHLGGGSTPIFYVEAPDGTLWNTKTNTYLDTVEFGQRSISATGTATERLSAMVIEAAINLSADTPPTVPTPPVFRALNVRQAVKRGAFF